ncbi:MAG: superoxide dismutase family protein [Leptothrix sp. (in: b-proteobacteria)]
MNLTLRPLISLSIAAAAVLSLGGCSGMHRGMHGDMRGDMGPSATAQLEPTKGNTASGTVMLMQHGDHVMVHAKLSGLTPGQEHGFHLHEKGDCSSGDGTSAGPHFNPTAQPHGPQGAAHHAGDMPSLKADANGQVDAMFHLTGVSLSDGPTNLIGRGVIVHAGPDDYATQPTGNSGARIACGVIVAAAR